MSDELNLENLDAVPAEEPVVEASEAAADEAAAPVEPVADLSAESDASVDNADVESDAPAATESAPVASTQTETVSLDEDEEEVNESEQAEETDAGQQAVDEFSKSLRSLDGKWYVLHTYSGYENKVKTNLETRIETMGLENNVFAIEIPTETVTEIKEGGRRKESEKKVFPGYVLVRMELDDRSWAAVRNTPGVTGFVGADSKPAPLTRDEYNKIMKRTSHEAPKKTSTNLEAGQAVKVVSGPLAEFDGVVSEVMPDAGKVKVMVSIFGRETPVELSFDQVSCI